MEEKRILDNDKLRELLGIVDKDAVAEKMTAALTDPEVPTYDMFEDIIYDYRHGSEEFRKGMEKMFEILTDKSLNDFVQDIADTCLRKLDDNEW